MTGWVGVVTALSTAVIAGALVIYVAVAIHAMRRMDRMSDSLMRLLETLDRDARPALLAARTAAEEASRVAILIRREVEGIAGTSESLRTRVDRTAASLEDRFAEFEALLDVLQDEVEDTVLDVAAALRTTRRGANVVRSIKRALLRR